MSKAIYLVKFCVVRCHLFFSKFTSCSFLKEKLIQEKKRQHRVRVVFGTLVFCAIFVFFWFDFNLEILIIFKI